MPHRAKAFNRTYPASSDSEFPPSRSPSPGARDVEMNYSGGGTNGTGGGGAGVGGSLTGNESDEYGGAYESDEPHTHHRRHLMPPAPSYTSYSRHKRQGRSATTPASSSSPSSSTSTSMGTKWTADEYLQLLDHVLVYGTGKSGFATAVPGRNKNQAYLAWRRVVLPACRAALVAKAQNR